MNGKTHLDLIGLLNMRVFVRRFCVLLAFIALLWAAQAVNWAVGYRLNLSLGLIPRHLSGLDGIVAMPLLHGNLAHLISNTVPLLLMGTLIAATATRGLFAVNAVIILLGGALVWIFGSSAIHIGASGLVFGWFGFLVARGLVDRSLATLAAAVLVGVAYGSILWGVLPGQAGISWEAHLFGAIAGVTAALRVPTHVHAPRMRDVEQW